MEFKLTDNEKLVLWGLIEYPDFNDIELSEKLGFKRRTFSAIRTRLKNDGIFSNLVIPDFNALGCELLTVTYGSFNPLIKDENRLDGVQKITEREDIIYLNSTDHEFVIITVSKNFTEFQEKADELLRYYTQKEFLDDITSVHFPFAISRYNFFGVSGLIKTLFKLNVECEKKIIVRAKNKLSLTNKEKKVLYALVKMPGAKVSEMAHIPGATTHTISAIKKKLCEEHVIGSYNLPNFSVLDCELFALIHIKYKYHRRNDYGPEATEILKFNTEAESVSLSLFKNYTDYKTYYTRKLEYLKGNDLMEEKPRVLLFPVQKLRYVKSFSLAPLVKKLLDIEDFK